MRFLFLALVLLASPCEAQCPLPSLVVSNQDATIKDRIGSWIADTQRRIKIRWLQYLPQSKNFSCTFLLDRDLKVKKLKVEGLDEESEVYFKEMMSQIKIMKPPMDIPYEHRMIVTLKEPGSVRLKFTPPIPGFEL